MTPEIVYVLRTCNPDMTSYGGFRWPESGPVEAPDWDASPHCGNGLHGFFWGEGDGGLASWDENAKWLVVAVESSTIVDIGGKVKFPRGEVVFVGNRFDATQRIRALGARGAVVGITLTGGDRATLTGGDRATLTGGDGATLTGGDGATLTGGDRATLTGGDGATLTGGDRATLTGGDGATLTGGDGATLTGGDRATLTGGDRATLTGGYYATLTGGDYATLTGGYGATLTGGDGATLTGGNRATLTGGDRATLTGGDRATLTGGYGATLSIRYYDRNAQRYRIAIAYVGENNIQPNVAYRLDDNGNYVQADQA